ncbi:MAG TPA: ribonuclease P protein component [Giesbergeria sp.]|jgi:ribonuclease P protein component|nr:ribonuclease P protein component [Giesbergeria sp.]HNE72585.1 ribonuclease P protein component [Giesbergeria sp.]HNK06770.1 ribonuclease P protein component [Giesbergeria sp.]HNM40983.1 ribonuclease P protein component [Giesbergeria sp.]HNN16781.1 ribonuclease P protein component [Giesbergeria sp.]
MQRLKTRPQFQATLAGETVARTAHFALHRLVLQAQDVARPPEGASQRHPRPLFGVQDVWLGAMVPKRWARRAVTRNAIKRQIFAVAALNATRLPPAAHVVRLRSAFDRKQFVSARSEALCQAVRAELLQLFERSSRKALPEAASAGSAAP